MSQSMYQNLSDHNNIGIICLELKVNLLILDIEGAEALRDGIGSFSDLIDLKLNLEDINIGQKQMEIISEGIKQLINLRFLVLSIYANSEIGEIGCQGIGNALSNLVLLEELQIIIQKWNKIKSQGAINIGKGIRNLKKLQKLNIQFGDDNFINIEGIQGFFEGVQDLNELKELYFYYGKNNFIGEKGFQQFGLAIQNLQKLQKLSILIDKNNKISPNGMVFVQKGFQALSQHLCDLKLHLNFDPEFNNLLFIELSNCLKCLKNLNSLQLEINTESNIEKRAGLELYRSICELKNLQSIQLNLDKLFILQFVSLPQELKQLEQNNFQLFCLKCIKFKRQKVLFFNLPLRQDLENAQQQYQQHIIKDQSDIIDENYALTELYVSVDKQNIQAEGILSLTQALQRLCFLQRLYIEILPNAVHAEGARNLAFSFKYLQNLQKLHLKISQSNNISEMGAKYIEQNLKYLNNLVSFSFSLGKSNFIGKKGFKFLVQGIKNIPNIKIIKFSINPINNISREDFHILIEESCNWRYLIQLSLKIKFADQYSQQLFANNLQIELSKLKYLIKLKCKFPYSNRKHHKYIFMRRVHRLVFAQ